MKSVPNFLRTEYIWCKEIMMLELSDYQYFVVFLNWLCRMGFAYCRRQDVTYNVTSMSFNLCWRGVSLAILHHSLFILYRVSVMIQYKSKKIFKWYKLKIVHLLYKLVYLDMYLLIHRHDTDKASILDVSVLQAFNFSQNIFDKKL